ncbi:hypothetical protein H6P81_003600 [Aristolochia fimbriata]|uniref:Uncharacterized protein n=1 Tax=Aristolochia fimbriata TaxID=158543 RepID=A0AAV7FH09_ARIFI|nr:hypothetical protein H6P81_003600 [Aristolochia fimbriata]
MNDSAMGITLVIRAAIALLIGVGADMLMFVFPILFVAVLGSIYLHLTKSDKQPSLKKKGSKTNRVLALWRRPLLVKGPLGIVTGTELTFFAMFVALVIWTCAMFLHGSYAKMNDASAHRHGDKLWEAKLQSAGLRLGLVGRLCFLFLFFPVTLRIVSVALGETQLGGDSQVSHMARTHRHDYRHCSWPLLRRLLGC